jgi:hypothetical protein
MPVSCEASASHWPDWRPVPDLSPAPALFDPARDQALVGPDGDEQLKSRRSAVYVPPCPGRSPHLLHHHIGTVSEGGSNGGLLVTGSCQDGCLAFLKIARHGGYERTGLYITWGVPGARPTASDRAFSPRWAAKVSKLARCSAVARCAAGSRLASARLGRTRLMTPPRFGSGSALRPSARTRRRLTSSWGRSQCRHHLEGAVHAQLVGAVTTALGPRRTASGGGEPDAVRSTLMASLPRVALNAR